MGDTSGIDSTFYSDPSLGIGWGDQPITGGSNPEPTQMECFTFSKIKSISQIRITTTWDAVMGVGYLYMGNEVSPSRYTNFGEFYGIMFAEGFMSTMNAWPGSVGGRERATDHVSDPDIILATFDGNGAGEEVELTKNYTSNGNLQICMSGEESYTYDRRFVKSLSFK